MHVAIQRVCSPLSSASKEHGVGAVRVPTALNGAGVGPGLNRIDPGTRRAVVRFVTVRTMRGSGRMDFGTVVRSVRGAIFQPQIRASHRGAPCAAIGPFSHTPAQLAASREAEPVERYRSAAWVDVRHFPADGDRPLRLATPMNQRAPWMDPLQNWARQLTPPDESGGQSMSVDTKSRSSQPARPVTRVVFPLPDVRHHE